MREVDDDPFLETILEMARALAPEDPLRQLAAAVTISGEMSNASTEAIYQLLNAAFDAGHSWSEIGAALKLGPNQQGSPWSTSLSIYEGLTSEAAECIFRSIHEANGLRHNYVGTETFASQLDRGSFRRFQCFESLGHSIPGGEVQDRNVDRTGAGKSPATEAFHSTDDQSDGPRDPSRDKDGQHPAGSRTSAARDTR